MNFEKKEKQREKKPRDIENVDMEGFENENDWSLKREIFDVPTFFFFLFGSRDYASFVYILFIHSSSIYVSI